MSQIIELTLERVNAIRAESPMFKCYPIKTSANGRTYNAAYELQDGRVIVSSAYGSKSAPEGKDAKATAEKLFDEIVKGAVH